MFTKNIIERNGLNVVFKPFLHVRYRSSWAFAVLMLFMLLIIACLLFQSMLKIQKNYAIWIHLPLRRGISRTIAIFIYNSFICCDMRSPMLLNTKGCIQKYSKIKYWHKIKDNIIWLRSDDWLLVFMQCLWRTFIWVYWYWYNRLELQVLIAKSQSI